ncbi:MAG: hypothetical protein OEY56_11225 [Cyclobacteriaceae bacterium]|nr:hypothetical protein [Cyclobacteriaceae bacterium]
MRTFLFFIMVTTFYAGFSQQPASYFYNTSANTYIEGDLQKALGILNEGIRQYPSNQELKDLKRRITDEEEQKQDKQEKEEQEKKEEENKENQQNQEQNQQEQDQEKKEGENQEQQEQQDGEEKKEENQNEDMNTRQKLEEMNISEEKAEMILEAMKNSEIQYLQQQKRKAGKRPQSGKPDW